MAERLTFAEWFKREYPLYEREGENRDTSFRAALRIAWETAQALSSRSAALEEAWQAAAMAINRDDGSVLDSIRALAQGKQKADRP